MPPPVIQLEKVRKSFAMPGGERVDVLDIDSFAVAPGEHLALEGFKVFSTEFIWAGLPALKSA